jgi:light-regulated signal transduction histidine kinase (bacteriophytochrome)
MSCIWLLLGCQPICQRVVNRYGGRIWVESQVDQGGATFYFTLLMGAGLRGYGVIL